MSGLLFRYFYEDDVDTFRQVLEEAAVTNRAHAQKSNVGGQGAGFALTVGSPGGIATSPTASYDSRKGAGVRARLDTHKISFHDVTLTRGDVNRKDGKGMTLLHRAASATNENALGFALALIAHPLIDLYIQDLESGWTALHRAFYFGNITTARAILERDGHDAIGQASAGTITHSPASLIKVKDREGNGPFDILTATVSDRTLEHHDPSARHSYFEAREDEEDEEVDSNANEDDELTKRKAIVNPLIDVQSDELFTFGSNKNITLGLGNQDDRQYPERVLLKRPEHLFRRFYREHVEQHAAQTASSSLLYAEKVRSKLRHSKEMSELPSVIRFRQENIQDVQMAKFHTAVLTNDPVSNLYMCGHGLGGRLGTGGEKTQFSFICVEDFGSARKKIVAIALGQDHSLAVTDQGEIFSWGSNAFGQLGVGLSKAPLNPDEAIQLLPKQIFGPLKRETVVGVAASRIHSVAHTSTALFTWGKNEGQLGIVDAHAGSLEVQSIPRRIAASRFSCAIQSVTAIDRATVCLMENHEVHVFANYGIVKLQFPLDGFTNYFLKKSFLATRYDDRPNCIVKVTGGGDTICALSSAGEIFAVTVDQRLDPGSSSTTSTTNPNKIKAALSTPSRVWSLKKGHMTAKDVGVDQDGSIILSTEAGSVWRRVRRTNLTAVRGTSASDKKLKDFKFSRVPGLTRVVAVRASASGAYCAMRRDCDVTRSQILPADKTLWRDISALLPFKNLAMDEDSDAENPAPRFWSRKPDALARLIARLAESEDIEKDISLILAHSPNEHCDNYDMFIRTTVSDVKIPIHHFMLTSRSRVLRQILTDFRQTGFATNDLLSFSTTDNGDSLLTFQGLDILTVVEFVLYIYTDSFVGFWLRTRQAPKLAFRYRQVRTELMKIASRLELRNLESAARRVAATAEPSMDKDFELAISDSNFFQGGDAMVELLDAEVLVHTDLLSRRCPFFEGLFQGRAGGRWLAARRDLLGKSEGAVGIDMKHVELRVFRLVIRHVYADTGAELFDDIVTKDLDEFLDIVLDVLSVANELMLDRLSQICQMVLGRYVNVRNACHLLNAIGPSAVTDFKDAGLEYLCLNLEAMLSNHLLDELDEDLLHDLDTIVRDNQLASLPYAKSGRAEAVLHENHPELAALIDRDRRAKIDSVNLHTKFSGQGASFGTSFDLIFDDDLVQTPTRAKLRMRPSAPSTGPTTPAMNPQSPSILPGGSPRDSGFISPKLYNASGQRSISITGQAQLTGFPSSPPLPVSPLTPSDTSFGMLPAAALRVVPPSTRSPILDDEESGHPSTSRPWGASPLPSTKLGIKEIMDQASSRTSNIALGLASQSQASVEDGPSSSFALRVSQKERRRQQQRQQNEALPSPRAVDNSASSPSTSSPWQSVTPRSKSLANFLDPENNSSPTSTQSPAQPSFNTPQLTMRQTIANNPSTGKQKAVANVTTRSPQPPLPQRSVSTPQATRPPPPPNMSSSSASKPIEIQSIRHSQRSPAESMSSTLMIESMADILSQQQAEKTVIKEAVAKRSLMEIQQEQEFLSWWDQERNKVMEEEASAERVGSERGRGRGRGSGKGGPGRAKERGGRGRGRGKERAAQSAPVAGQ